MEKRSIADRVREGLPLLIAFLCAAFMLAVLPLAFHDAFFDINRFKVNLVTSVIPFFIVAMAAALLIRFRPLPFAGRELAAAQAAFALFLLACVIACALRGFDERMLQGSAGRYCGLSFLLCCGAAYYVVSTGALSGRVILPLVVFCAAFSAVLGVMNTMGMDPLKFYAEIKAGQQTQFLSTIGNLDFFGAYLAMLLPLAAGGYVFLRRTLWRNICGICCAVIALGVAASRSDSAFFAVQLAFCALLMRSGNSLAAMGRAFLLWAQSWLSLPILQALMRGSLWEVQFSGVLLKLCDTHLATAIAVACAGLCVLCYLCEHKGVCAPGRRRVAFVMTVCLVVAVVLALGCVAYFSIADVHSDLGALSSVLRFDDQWGTRRGFVWRCAAAAYADYTPLEKLFGKGIDMTESILQPYFDNPAMLAYGVFNDAHNQLLQFLLTGGFLAASALAAFHVLTLRALWRRAGEDALLDGAFAALLGYTLIALLSVTQPIVISTYISVAALAASRLNHVHAKGGELHES